MMIDFLPIFLLGFPLLVALLIQFFPYSYKVPLFSLIGVALLQLFGLLILKNQVPFFAWGTFLMIDHLSLYFLFIFFLVFLISSTSCLFYFKEQDALEEHAISRMAGLWLLTDMAIIFILISNHLALMWVGMETTTLLTAWLIYDKRKKNSLEALWKYLIICTVGIGFAMIGTILLATSAIKLSGADPIESLMWNHLFANASFLNVSLLKTGFIFMFIGYGTKIGIAPMHTCLPDTYYAAPFPVASLFSGFISTSALYCLFKIILILEIALPDWLHTILMAFGVFSLIIATLFICFQKSLTRLLAYSSIEQMALIIISIGLGPKGFVPALWQLLYHSLSKSFAFVCSGQISSFYASSNMRTMERTMSRYPLWGMGLGLSFFALMGVPPFPLFFSKLLILKEIVLSLPLSLVLLIFTCLLVVFIEFMRYLIGMAWRSQDLIEDEKLDEKVKVESNWHVLYVLLFIMVLLTVGYCFPSEWMMKIQNELMFLN